MRTFTLTEAGRLLGTSHHERRLHTTEKRLGHLERPVGRLEHELDLAVTLLKSLVGQPGSAP